MMAFLRRHVSVVAVVDEPSRAHRRDIATKRPTVTAALTLGVETKM